MTSVRQHLEFYASVVDRLAADDPRLAVGGLWDQVGQLQFEFMKSRGLEPGSTMLDLGCGCLRGGLRYIDYLRPGRYVGVDISRGILAAAGRFLEESGLAWKRPIVRLVRDQTFDWAEGRSFDYIIAQSVLTHLTVDAIDDLFVHVPRVMHRGSEFYATFFDADREAVSPDAEVYWHPFDRLAGLARGRGLDAELLPFESFPHPRRQRVMRVRLAPVA